MSISKTRQKLVDVARQLFAKNGIANTTMNDIAVASGKGRRTLYTYFSRKEDVYYAVIESELERLSDKLDEVANCKMRPQDKIIELIYTHLSMIKETVVRNGNLRAEFFRNIWMVEKARKNFDEDEIEIFRRVYAEGKEDGEFDIDNIPELHLTEGDASAVLIIKPCRPVHGKSIFLSQLQIQKGDGSLLVVLRHIDRRIGGIVAVRPRDDKARLRTL